MIHTVKGFGVVNKAEEDVFLELSCFFKDPAIVSYLISGSSAFSKSNGNLEGTGSPAPSHLLPQPGTPSRGYSLGRVLGVGWLLHSHRPFLTFPGKGEILHLITQSWGQVIVGLQLQIIILKKNFAGLPWWFNG